MTFLDEVAARLVAQGVGVLGTSLFLSSSAVIPTGPGPYVTVAQTGGTAPDRTQNSVSSPAYQRPSAQILVRASTYVAAETRARAAYNALIVRNSTLSGTWYREIDPIQEPFDMGIDSLGRAQVAFNVTAIKRPS